MRWQTVWTEDFWRSLYSCLHSWLRAQLAAQQAVELATQLDEQLAAQLAATLAARFTSQRLSSVSPLPRTTRSSDPAEGKTAFTQEIFVLRVLTPLRTTYPQPRLRTPSDRR
jgi:hypothetical protein